MLKMKLIFQYKKKKKDCQLLFNFYYLEKSPQITQINTDYIKIIVIRVIRGFQYRNIGAR